KRTPSNNPYDILADSYETLPAGTALICLARLHVPHEGDVAQRGAICSARARAHVDMANMLVASSKRVGCQSWQKPPEQLLLAQSELRVHPMPELFVHRFLRNGDG